VGTAYQEEDVEFTGEVHPVADIFPMLDDDELESLAKDIRANGLLNPLSIDGEGRLLDGRNRLAACKAAGVEPRFEVYDGDPLALVLSANIARRHLVAGARALLVEQARRLTGSTKKDTASNHASVISENRLGEAGLVLDWASELVPGVMAGESLKSAAQTARDRKRAADSEPEVVAQIKARAPELYELIEAGTLTVAGALAELRQRDEDREAALRRAASRLRSLVDGWVQLEALIRDEDRDAVLSQLDARDRESVLEIEDIYRRGRDAQ
jgi:hypothetical protein